MTGKQQEIPWFHFYRKPHKQSRIYAESCKKYRYSNFISKTADIVRQLLCSYQKKVDVTRRKLWNNQQHMVQYRRKYVMQVMLVFNAICTVNLESFTCIISCLFHRQEDHELFFLQFCSMLTVGHLSVQYVSPKRNQENQPDIAGSSLLKARYLHLPLVCASLYTLYISTPSHFVSCKAATTKLHVYHSNY